jgi:hypothetical protein
VAVRQLERPGGRVTEWSGNRGDTLTRMPELERARPECLKGDGAWRGSACRAAGPTTATAAFTSTRSCERRLTNATPSTLDTGLPFDKLSTTRSVLNHRQPPHGCPPAANHVAVSCSRLAPRKNR